MTDWIVRHVPTMRKYQRHRLSNSRGKPLNYTKSKIGFLPSRHGPVTSSDGRKYEIMPNGQVLRRR